MGRGMTLGLTFRAKVSMLRRREAPSRSMRPRRWRERESGQGRDVLDQAEHQHPIDQGDDQGAPQRRADDAEPGEEDEGAAEQ